MLLLPPLIPRIRCLCRWSAMHCAALMLPLKVSCILAVSSLFKSHPYCTKISSQRSSLLGLLSALVAGAGTSSARAVTTGPASIPAPSAPASRGTPRGAIFRPHQPGLQPHGPRDVILGQPRRRHVHLQAGGAWGHHALPVGHALLGPLLPAGLGVCGGACGVLHGQPSGGHASPSAPDIPAASLQAGGVSAGPLLSGLWMGSRRSCMTLCQVQGGEKADVCDLPNGNQERAA